jgi:hypothetical protein
MKDLTESAQAGVATPASAAAFLSASARCVARWLTPAALAAAVFIAAAQAQTTFQDSTFNDNDWTDGVIQSNQTSDTYEASQQSVSSNLSIRTPSVDGTEQPALHEL